MSNNEEITVLAAHEPFFGDMAAKLESFLAAPDFPGIVRQGSMTLSGRWGFGEQEQDPYEIMRWMMRFGGKREMRRQWRHYDVWRRTFPVKRGRGLKVMLHTHESVRKELTIHFPDGTVFTVPR